MWLGATRAGEGSRCQRFSHRPNATELAFCHRPGDPCTNGAGCLNAQTSLECENNVLKAFPCGGGCTQTATTYRCEMGDALQVGACPLRVEGLGRCSADAGAMVLCTKNRWAEQRCARGCSTLDAGLRCLN